MYLFMVLSKMSLKDWQNHILRVFCHWKVSMNYPKMGKNHKFSLKLLVKSVTTGGISTIEIIKCLISNWFFHTYIIFSHFWHFTLGKNQEKWLCPFWKKFLLHPWTATQSFPQTFVGPISKVIFFLFMLNFVFWETLNRVKNRTSIAVLGQKQ